jgi:hypothetical protein
MDHQHEGQVAGSRDRGEILDRIVAHVLQQIRICRMRRVGGDEQRVAIRRSTRDEARRDRAVGARLVFDHRADAERRAELLADQRVVVSVPLPAAKGSTSVMLRFG